MGRIKYPPLNPNEIVAILNARGFSFYKSSGDHNFYIHSVKGKKRVVQVDMGCPSYVDHWLKTAIKETGMTREQFYCSTKGTAKKINLKCAAKEELSNWVLA
jgi:predicted RNA binding protein YcfA (HicA-like mRNA interferase family)